jgi:hypothetical protein
MILSNGARLAGLVAAVAMFVFSLWMYSRTGDWVAAVFAVGSVAYVLFFFGAGPRND